MRKILRVLTITCAAFALSLPTLHADNDDLHLLKRDLPEQWIYTSEVDQTLPADDTWWKRFNDPLLDSLIAIGMDNNFNVLTAIHRMDMAKAQIRGAEAAYYPTFNLNAGFTKSRNAGAVSGRDVLSTNSSYFNLGASMQWQIDVFGKITAGVKNKKALYRASRADYAGTMISLAADIATYYFNLRIFQRQLLVTHEHLASQDSVVAKVKARFEAGLVSKLDVAQALTVYYSTQATLPQLESSVEQAVNALATLLGVYPEDIAPVLTAPWVTPDYRHLIPADVPANLIRRRPDIIAAESEVSAYAAQLGIAKKDFLPTLTLNGTIGVSAHNAGHLFKENSMGYTIAPTLTWTLFDGFARKSAVREARDQMKIGIESYNLTVMTAVQEVNNAIISYRSALRAIDSYTNVIRQCTESFHLSVDLYTQGLTSFTNVVDAQINSLTYANTLISARGNAFISLINLYKSLGGSPVEL